MLAAHPFGQSLHLVNGVERAEVMASCELRDVAVKVRRTHPVEGSGNPFLNIAQNDSMPFVWAISTQRL